MGQPWPIIRLAYLYMSRQNIPENRQYLAKALTIDPNLQPARDMLNSLGGAQLAQQAGGMIQQANQIYQQSGQLYQQANQMVSHAGQSTQAGLATQPASSVVPATSLR